MKLPDYYSYTATFTKEVDGWLVEFPDLERCVTNADTLDEAIIQANNILEDYMAILERDGLDIPAPTPYEKIQTQKNCEKQRIVVSMQKARERWKNKSVKKIIRIPAWINQKAVNAGLNFSQILQSAILKKLAKEDF